MDFIYKAIDIYLTFFIAFFDIFLRHSTAQVFGTFAAYIYPLYISIVPMWLTAGGDYLEDLEKDDLLYTSITFSFLTTGLIYFLRGFGETEMSAGYFLLGYGLMFGSTLSYRFNTSVISNGIDRHDKKY